MPYSYILHEKAQIDYEISLSWYLERSEQVANNFISAIDDALALICSHPDRWRNTYKNYHELGLRKFPFTIIYIIEKDSQQILVTSIYHHKRNPKKRFKKKQ